MSGETEKDVSGLTTDTLRLLMEAEVRRIDERFSAFMNTYERDQEKANEFRAALDDLSKTMATRRELTTSTEAITQRFTNQQAQMSELRSRLDVGPAGLHSLQAYQQQQEGRQEGIGASIGLIVLVVSVTAGLVGILVALANHVP